MRQGGASVTRIGWLVVAALGLVPWAAAEAHCLPRPFELDRINRDLAGHIVDYTHNTGTDYRIWSPALCERRDLYVYLPPCYDPAKKYPLILWLHGFGEDEQYFLTVAVRPLDKAMRCGAMPPCIVAAPDGSLRGVSGLFSGGSFFLNTPVGGRFEDYLMQDVWDFLFTNYPLRPERDAHLLMGVSMGGAAAYHTAIKYPDRFGSVLAFIPPLNVRWQDCRGRNMANFDPNSWGWRTEFNRGLQVDGRFYLLLTVRERRVSFPLYGRNDPNVAELISHENPIEMLDAYDVRDGQFNMYIAYAGRDQFNCDAQVESFLFHAGERGLHVTVDYWPRGHHDTATVRGMTPAALEWAGQKLAPYAPHD